ncbi:SIR2 family NAD-dependent protein deacylase [Teredinibacter waterburyi]|uniref:SIR2 family NAD-dependent protein deacylase n=1 Tax=Teredinibacter waterburyi TaxID=1500538 RepID=UPI00165EC84E|nr:Sir2 family NAD-dependent protein deacetylase [Teredinibacter waterburyi]
MPKDIDYNKIVIFTGAGVSAESGIRTFRDLNGYWKEFSIEEVATPCAWKNNPEAVLSFYNERREIACKAEPNEAHFSIAALEKKYDVIVITQNVDDLHERAGSSNVIHLHGELGKARSTSGNEKAYSINGNAISIGDLCPNGSQLRPHIVWFGEDIQNYEEAMQHIKLAGRIMVVGTSLNVYPAAGMLKKARHRADKVLITLDVDKRPYGYNYLQSKATEMVPFIVERWLKGLKST